VGREPAEAADRFVAASAEPLGQKSASGNQWAADADFLLFISREQSAKRDPRLLVASYATPQMSGMGRFATTAPLYEQFRAPYFPEFFRTVAQKLMLGRQYALIDLGTGPGLIALGFAPYVGRVVGVDPEPAMLEAAKRAASRAGLDVELIESAAEQLPRDVGPFDVVTIGRALHWMDRNLVGSLLERLVAPGGMILVCSARSVDDGRNGWLDAYNEARRYWSGATDLTRHRQDLSAILAGTRFRIEEPIAVESSHELSARDLAYRTLTFSTSSPAALGGKVDAMLHDVEQRLLPFGRNGLLREVVIAKTDVARSPPL
jgi:predicted O-methyltransferase YrrM